MPKGRHGITQSTIQLYMSHRPFEISGTLAHIYEWPTYLQGSSQAGSTGDVAREELRRAPVTGIGAGAAVQCAK